MNSFLLIAVYGATLAIALAFTFTEYGNEKNTTGYKKSHDDFEPEFEDALSDLNRNAEDYGFYKNEPEADIDDEKDDNEGEESDVLDLEKRAPDPKSRKGHPRRSLIRPKVGRALLRRRRSGVRRRRRNG
ncbi:uncharacterized protein LOC113682486 [Pocillopora damicornis]|uniref:uncharacterized protein LOC113682486 n=1 Tax=Pocillopora damicornis TaxID=46731 RepID=UPI000F559775|nr:uncharacterized protein LOC113682486 [Pocillopora damicornis]